MRKRTYLITGASSDVGVALVAKLLLSLSKGDTIIAHYHSNCKELKELSNNYSDISFDFIKADFSKSDEIDMLIKHIKEQYGIITHIVHLPACKMNNMKVKQIEWDLIEKELQIQVHSLAEILKECLPIMAKEHYGKVVIMLTSAILSTPPKSMVNYVVSKYALLGLLKSCAVEYTGKGITINGISPNIMETGFWEKIDSRYVQIGIDHLAMKRGTKLSETVSGIEFLLSEGSDYMNGSNLNMSGGDWM